LPAVATDHKRRALLSGFLLTHFILFIVQTSAGLAS
jgi:hypothetical protein